MLISNFTKIRPVGAELLQAAERAVGTDGWMDEEANSRSL